MAEVLQCDRDAAADFLDSTGVDWGACGDVREGRVQHPAVQAFAAVREAAEKAERQAVVGFVRQTLRRHSSGSAFMEALVARFENDAFEAIERGDHRKG